MSNHLQELREGLQRTDQRLAPPPTGPWVVIGVLHFIHSRPRAVPLLGGDLNGCMRGHPTVEEAMAASAGFTAGRQGGWVINIDTGETVRFGPLLPLHHVHDPIP